MKRETRSWLRWLLALLVMVVLVLLTYINYQFALGSPGGNDFLARWVGARAWLVEGINPYDPQVSLEAQELIYGRPADIAAGEDIAHFVYPLPSMLFFGPFAFLPFPLARALWMTVLELGLILLTMIGLQIVRWRPAPIMLGALLLFSIVWYHGLRAVIVGQFAVIEALLMLGALLALQRERDILAGVLLALSIAKPQMSFLLITYLVLYSLADRRSQFLAAFAASSAILIGGSLLLIPGWPILWLRQVLDYTSYTFLGSPVSIITSILPGSGQVAAWILSLLLIIYLVWEWYLSSGESDRWLQWTAAVTIVITNLISLRTATTNYVVLIPALLLILYSWEDRWGARGRLAIYLALFIMFVGLWALFLTTVEGNIEAAGMYLPVPIFIFLGLLWVRWWAIRDPFAPIGSKRSGITL